MAPSFNRRMNRTEQTVIASEIDGASRHRTGDMMRTLFPTGTAKKEKRKEKEIKGPAHSKDNST